MHTLATVGLLSRYEREPQGDYSQAALLPLPLALLPREPSRRASSDYDHKAPSSITFLSTFAETTKTAESVLAHGQEEKREFIEEERAQITTLLGATRSMSPRRTMGKTGDY